MKTYSTSEIAYCSDAFLYPCSTFLPFHTSTAPDRCSQERPKEDLPDPTLISYYHATSFHFHVSRYSMPVVAYNNGDTSSYLDPIWSPCSGFSHTSPEPYTCTTRLCPSHQAVVLSFPPNKELQQQNSSTQAASNTRAYDAITLQKPALPPNTDQWPSKIIRFGNTTIYAFRSTACEWTNK